MGVIRQRIHGALLKDSDRLALFLEKDQGSLYLSYALEVKATGQHILPESLLDDWGHEITGLSIYSWIRENGPQFPRAELFGFILSGEPRQYFLRELELASRYACYVYSEKQAPVADGILVDTVFISDDGVEKSKRLHCLGDVPSPLNQTKVTWWLVHPDTKIPF